ncbi:hypothetical protein NA57DRAFT_30640 [Rhizodiscina lignyota]|uniref:P-loop containing nucleoside triphosphate hydrolase protein n=1 Tax=Rhizodiscina lignyota TaxID=1504668 RepID=A0A9P4ILE7_9PEZI|nr:hypothetical protein NA57DRAFT_30640 [Rhizodiscina lignyota]
MAKKPIFSATHPRAISSAFERVFLTRQDMQCFHEPFGDVYYHGKERLGDRYEDDKLARTNSGFSNATYKDIFDAIEKGGSEGKRVFIKDMAYYLMPPDDKPPSIAPSLVNYKRGVGTTTNGELNGHSNGAAVAPVNGDHSETRPYPYTTKAEPGNPTVVPEAVLKRFHFTFLIRHPRSSIPSYWRCTVPPLNKVTGFYDFMPSEAGYAELVRLFDYLRGIGLVGPSIAGQAKPNGTNGVNGTNGEKNDDKVEICVIDADDMLDNPEAMIKTYCKSINLEYKPEMLNWDNEEDQERARAVFEKWPGFHDDALDSTHLKKREHKKKPKSDDQLYQEWTEKFGEEAAKTIRQTVEENVPHYEYLKQFAIKV